MRLKDSLRQIQPDHINFAHGAHAEGEHRCNHDRLSCSRGARQQNCFAKDPGQRRPRRRGAPFCGNLPFLASAGSGAVVVGAEIAAKRPVKPDEIGRPHEARGVVGALRVENREVIVDAITEARLGEIVALRGCIREIFRRLDLFVDGAARRKRVGDVAEGAFDRLLILRPARSCGRSWRLKAERDCARR